MRNFSQNLQIQQYHLYIINMNQKYFSLKAVQKFWKNWEYPKGDTRRQWRHTRGLESVALAIPIFGTYLSIILNKLPIIWQLELVLVLGGIIDTGIYAAINIIPVRFFVN